MKMKFSTLIVKIESDKFEIDYGNLFLNFLDPKEHLVKFLKNVKTNYNTTILRYKDKIKDLKKEAKTDENDNKIKYYIDYINDLNNIEVHKNGLLEYDFRPMYIHSPMIAANVNLCLLKNKLTFVDRENYILEAHLKPNPVTWNTLNVIEPTDITCKSGKLIFANHFNNMYGDIPDNLRYSDEFNICGILGQRNTQKYLAKNYNLGYGQTSNTSLDFYSNGTEIIALEYDFDFFEELKKYEYEKFGKNIEDLERYMVDFEHYGSVSMGVWRYEFVDSEVFDEDSFTNDFIEVPITKGTLEHYHYYGEVVKSPINPFIKMHIIHKV